MTKTRTFRQIVSFGAVGLTATLTHVAIAWTAFEAFGSRPALANLMGAVAAFFVSFLCNAALTFDSSHPVSSTAPRYIALTIASYLLATGIMLFVESRDLPTYVFAAAVLIIVPAVTFPLAKFWVFGPASGHSFDRGW